MPTYTNHCPECGWEWEAWQSIHDADHPNCQKCSTPTIRAITKVTTYAVGSRGAHTARSDKTDQVWHKDMAAYKRFVDKGVQPRAITGADRLEATAVSNWHVQTGQKHSDEMVSSRMEEARSIVRSSQ